MMTSTNFKPIRYFIILSCSPKIDFKMMPAIYYTSPTSEYITSNNMDMVHYNCCNSGIFVVQNKSYFTESSSGLIALLLYTVHLANRLEMMIMILKRSISLHKK